ncbi:Protein-L-isoaspartate O-methyltransferase [Hartmannibacter diazotrophicus]|uniref:Protein-L-isoaspartate O-methyltransferase n=1 Tax=Hartmannibacter diazotrophicus TaxID=1482074 RepID=A0A2C9D7R4_9HYPH|nr:protein-L-isoaspartate O-methyltransferase [Hartmannibacter diazotrophicus]SON56178.1 Protein-L-isoaspartate O-methyltransferase [Hartmannibacter diazotrophicus]
MADSDLARTKMVDGQVRPSDVTDYRIIDAMLDIPREEFVPSAQRALAYSDLPISLGASGRAMLMPRVLAMMIQAADILPGDVVLDLGCGTGYSTAVIARLASSVVALEEDAALAAFATSALQDLGIDNAAVVEGPLAAGYEAEGPYDVIIVEGAVEILPDTITDQLKDGGRLLVIEGRGLSARAMLYVRSGDDVSGRIVMNAAAPLLPGFAKEEEFVF